MHHVEEKYCIVTAMCTVKITVLKSKGHKDRRQKQFELVSQLAVQFLSCGQVHIDSLMEELSST